MKKTSLLIMVFLFCAGGLFAQTELPKANAGQTQETKAEPAKTAVKPAEIKLGKILFPKEFIHGDKTFSKGSYRVTLGDKESVPYFYLYDQKNQLLLEEMAIVVRLEGSKGGARGLNHEMVKGNEYFRIKLLRGDEVILGYFLLKPPTPPPAPPAVEPEKK